MHRNLSMFTVAAVLIVGGATAASAQEMAARHTLTALAGPVNFDLSGTGTTTGFAFRGTRALTPHLAVEAGFLFARPKLQDGERASLFVPEAHLQYYWRAGRVAPYAGGGIGFGRQSRDFVSVTDLAVSAAGGARVDLTERVAATGEFRLRGLGKDFSATTADWMAGLSFAVGR